MLASKWCAEQVNPAFSRDSQRILNMRSGGTVRMGTVEEVLA